MKQSNRDHFKGRENVDRVRAWRAAHPHYWRHRRCRERARRARFCLGKKRYGIARKLALQDSIDTQFSLVVGLVSHLTGHALQDTIANEIRRLMLLGREVRRVSAQAQLPLPPPESIPVAAYVRMSTEHQQYSTSNQLDRIKEFAAKRGMNIVRVFADEGKSGLNVKGRESLRR